ncbi:MAG: DNA-binding protein, partial [Pseudomonas putida]
MRRLIRLFLALAVIGLLLLGWAGQEFRLFERGWFNLKT